MLLQLVIENHRSIRDQVVLSMLAPAGTDRRFVAEVGGLEVLRCAAIYGANAAGKSNVIDALTTLSLLVRRDSGSTTGVQPHRLDPAWKTKPSRFEIEFVVDGAQYAYGVVATRTAISKEWLFRVEGEADTLLFEREDLAGTPEHTYRFGPDIPTERQQFLRFVGQGTAPHMTFAAECPRRNVTEFEVVNLWFNAALTLIKPDWNYHPLLKFLEDDAQRHDVISRLTAWGTGISHLQLRALRLPGSERKRLDLLDEPIDVVEDGEDIVLRHLQFSHATSSETLGWMDQSDGTRRLINLLPGFFRQVAASRASNALVVDELDRSLHPTLTRQFVSEFLSRSSQAGALGGQIIFTTHDTNLLSGRLLPTASIWFVQKDAAGATQLYSLSEYPPEQLAVLQEHLEEGYLQGRFGAIPFLATRDQLGW